jgi:hypothetical protein
LLAADSDNDYAMIDATIMRANQHREVVGLVETAFRLR